MRGEVPHLLCSSSFVCTAGFPFPLGLVLSEAAFLHSESVLPLPFPAADFWPPGGALEGTGFAVERENGMRDNKVFYTIFLGYSHCYHFISL